MVVREGNLESIVHLWCRPLSPPLFTDTSETGCRGLHMEELKAAGEWTRHKGCLLINARKMMTVLLIFSAFSRTR